VRLGEGFLDRFEVWLSEHQVPPEFLKPYRDGARKMITVAGEDAVRPKHVDLVIAREEKAGASPRALANLLKIGNALMDFQNGAGAAAPPPPSERAVPGSARLTVDLYSELAIDPTQMRKDLYRAWRAYLTADELFLIDAGSAETRPPTVGGGLLGFAVNAAMGTRGVREAMREQLARLEDRPLAAQLQRPGGHLRWMWSEIPSSKIAKHRWTIDQQSGDPLKLELVDRDDEERLKQELQTLLGAKLWVA
jgi:hypothetical protein